MIIKRFNLALPEPLYFLLKRLAKKQYATMNAYIVDTLRTRLEMDETGDRRCADGQVCVLLTHKLLFKKELSTRK